MPRVNRQTLLYLRFLRERGTHGATDWEAGVLLGLERTTINARRHPCCQGDDPWVKGTDTRPGPSGRCRNVVWSLTVTGRKALEDVENAR
jgi:hypothetical protein